MALDVIGNYIELPKLALRFTSGLMVNECEPLYPSALQWAIKTSASGSSKICQKPLPAGQILFDFKKGVKGLVFCLFALLSIYSKALAIDKASSFALSHYIMAVMQEDLGQFDEAVNNYKKALKKDYKSPVIHLKLAIAYLKKNNFPDAVKELKLAAELDPEAVEPHAILSLLYATQNQAGPATSEYEIALKNASKLEPKNIDIYKTLGQIYLQQQKIEAAENIYRLILDLSNGDAEAHFYLGSIYHESKNKEAAVRELKKTLELKPDYAEALNFLGYLYAEEGQNLEQAELMIKKALELSPDNAAYIDSLGWVYFKKARYNEAVVQLEKAVSLLDDPVICDHLGDAYLKAGQAQKAKENWEKSLKLDPKQEGVKKKIDAIQ